MGSLLFGKLVASPLAAGLFSTLGVGHTNLVTHWQEVAQFSGALVIIAAIVFTVMAVVKSRDKARWWWSSAIAWCVGAILLLGSTAVNNIQGDFSQTWSEVFGGNIDLIAGYLSTVIGIFL